MPAAAKIEKLCVNANSFLKNSFQIILKADLSDQFCTNLKIRTLEFSMY